MARHRFAEGRQAAFAYFSLPRKVGRRRQDKPKISAKADNRDEGATAHAIGIPRLTARRTRNARPYKAFNEGVAVIAGFRA